MEEIWELLGKDTEATREEIAVVETLLKDDLDLLHAVALIVMVEDQKDIWLVFVDVQLGEDSVNADASRGQAESLVDVAVNVVFDWAEINEHDLGLFCLNGRLLTGELTCTEGVEVVEPLVYSEGRLAT